MAYKPFEVVVVPFPFTDRTADKRRPALILSDDIKFNKPVVISEFGAGALAGFHGDEDTMWSEEYQELIYINQLEMLDKMDGLRGMTPWILVDFKSPRRQNPVFQNFWNRKGLLSNTGKKKKAYYILQNYYKNKTMD